MSESDVVLFANEAFYGAFADRDIKAMEQTWAANSSVCCIHPGWFAIRDREKILESWRSILKNPGSPDIRCRAAEVMMWGNVGAVVCFEQIGENYLMATNLYVQEGGQWRIVHHQAGLTNAPPPGEEEASGVMN